MALQPELKHLLVTPNKKIYTIAFEAHVIVVQIQDVFSKAEKYEKGSHYWKIIEEMTF